MSEEIIKVLNDSGERFGIAIDWTSQNVMPYIQDLASRYIVYNNLIAIVQIIISSVLIVVGIACIVKLVKESKKDKYFDEELFVWEIFGSLGLIALGIGLTIGNILGIIQNVCMPEITILEYIKTLM